MSKKRILLCSEATFINSGYANYGCQIMNRLYQTGEFELAEIGCFGKDHPSVSRPPWKIYYPVLNQYLAHHRSLEISL